jgi:hypothetical protein
MGMHGTMRNAEKILIGKCEVKDRLGDLRVDEE